MQGGIVIAILGATGYIGRSLARKVARSTDQPLALFARDPRRLGEESWPLRVDLRALDGFDAGPFELVVNAVGAGDPGQVQALGASILDVSDSWDRRVLTTMGPRTLYVFLSSGAVYGAFGSAVDENTELRLPVNRLGSVPPYIIAKLWAEARHRYAGDRAILDLRVFSYADEAISRNGRFFLAELAHCVVDDLPFRTSTAHMVRDYAGVDELWDLICCWTAAGAPNVAADLYSAEPVSKSALLSAVQERFGIVVENAALGPESPTGGKSVYASRYRVAESFGYAPRRTSLEIVLTMLDRMAATRRYSNKQSMAL
jgi:nucleoside-diphosphate-sugar epimerase